jgi:PhnB protein
MSLIPNYVPSGYKTLNVILRVRDVDRAIQFYNSALGADVLMELKDAEGRVTHAEIKITDTIIELVSSSAEAHNPNFVLKLYTGDVEGVFEDAVGAGAKILEGVKVEYNGDREGRLLDPFGVEWILATHEENLTVNEIKHRFQEKYS